MLIAPASLLKAGAVSGFAMRGAFAYGAFPLLSESHVMRMSHGRYPRSEQAYESPTNAPETEQQERDHETPGRHGRPVHYEVAWIAGDEAY